MLLSLIRQTALEGLPVFLREDSSALFRTCQDKTPEDRQTRGMKVGILIVIEDDACPSTLPSVIKFSVVLEEVIVLKDAADLQSALAYLFGLLFALDFEYPKQLKYTFEVIEKVFMEMGSTHCSPRDHRAAVEGKIYPLDMALNSVDDQYMGCRKNTTDLVKTKYLKEEINNSSEFRDTWHDGVDVIKYSKYPHQKEVLIPPYEKFMVTDVKTKGQDGAWCDTLFKLKSTGKISYLNCGVDVKLVQDRAKL
ncbi:unnamed protein product [Leuciscus chuanchicus]